MTMAKDAIVINSINDVVTIHYKQLNLSNNAVKSLSVFFPLLMVCVAESTVVGANQFSGSGNCPSEVEWSEAAGYMSA